MTCDHRCIPCWFRFSCHIDSVKGTIVQILFGSVVVIVVFVVNCVLYVVTLAKIYKQVYSIRSVIGSMPPSMQATHKATKTMSMFVLAYIVQWNLPCIYSLWSSINGSVPQIVLQGVTITANLGGVINLFVFLVIRGKQTSSSQHSSNTVSNNYI